MNSLEEVSFKKVLLNFFQVSLAFHKMNKRYEKKHNVSIVQWCVLKHLIDLPGTSAYLLAEAIGVHPSTLTQTLKRLEKKKFIFIDRDPLDSRKKMVSMTRLGKEKLNEIETDLMKELHRDSLIVFHPMESVGSFPIDVCKRR